jgi:WD40 repeat protein
MIMIKKRIIQCCLIACVAAIVCRSVVARLPSTNIKVLGSMGGSIRSVHFSPDGLVLASITADDRLRIWEVSSGKLAGKAGSKANAITSVAFVNNTLLAVGTRSGDIRLVARSVPSVARTTSHNRSKFAVASIVAARNGKALAVTRADRTLEIWDVNPLHRRQSWPGLIVTGALALSPDDRFIASETEGLTAKLWSGSTGRLVRMMPRANIASITSLCFSPDGALLAAAGGDGRVTAWNCANGMVRCSLRGETAISSLTFCNSGKWLATGTSLPRDFNPNKYGQVFIWDVATARKIQTIPNGNHTVEAIVIAPNQKTLAIGGSDGKIALVNLL